MVGAAHQINRGNLPTLPARGEVSDFYMIEVEDPEDIARTIVDLVNTCLPRKFGIDSVRDI